MNSILKLTDLPSQKMKEPNTHLDRGGGGGGNEINNLDTSKIGDGGGFDDISSPYLDYLDPGQISPDTSRKPCFAHPLLRVFGKKFKKDKGGYSMGERDRIGYLCNASKW